MPRKSRAWIVLVAAYVVTVIVMMLLGGMSEFEYVVHVLSVIWLDLIIVGAFLPYVIKRSASDILGFKRFADETGLWFDTKKDLVRTGMIFNRGRSPVFHTVFSGYAENGKPIEIANYTYVIGIGKSRQEITWGFIRVDLSRRLPRMVIDGRRNNFVASNLPEIFNESQRLQLEGSFSDFFDVYVPAGYENDALYVLTPDIMALIMDKADGYDIEITGDQLFVYADGGFDLQDPTNADRLVDLAKEFQREFEAQTDYYADERVGDRQANSVAEPGRRLRSGVNWTGLFILLFVLYYMNGGILPAVPDWVNLWLVFIMFGGVLYLAIREIMRLKKIKK